MRPLRHTLRAGVFCTYAICGICLQIFPPVGHFCEKHGRSRVSAFALWGLFSSAFLAATLLPVQSELVLAGMLATQSGPPWLPIAVATLGNTLGSVVNWLLGRLARRFAGRAWFPVQEKSLKKAEHWYHAYGRWSLLASWVPVIGDPLTIAAGALREPFWSFLAIVAAAKLARYLVVAAFALHLF